MESQLVTRIVKDSVLDGPGCRYTIFLKGCNLRCGWCHNPETQRCGQEILRWPQFCIQCGQCHQVAPAAANKETMPIDPRDSCDPSFFPCVDACPTEALSFAAREYDSDWLLQDMLKYKSVYLATDGGMTLSGGEPLLSPKFSLELLAKAKEAGLHTAVDTSGTFDWSIVEEFLDVVDLWLYDFKHINDPQIRSDLNMANLMKLSEAGAKIWIRIALIPGYNDTVDVWESMAQTLFEAGDAIEQVHLLPFHPYAGSKYSALGRGYDYGAVTQLEPGTEEKAQASFLKKIPADRISIGRSLIQG